MDPSAELDSLLDRWRREVYGNSGANPVPILTNIAELIERETEVYLKLPIDPFDERHPSRTYPDCTLGLLLKILFKNENFMTQLTTDYITARVNIELQVISSRLLLDILPGLDAFVVFKETEGLVEHILDRAEKSEFPLHSYATGLLGAAMQVDEISNAYRQQNNNLVPIIFNRLNQITQLFGDNKGIKRPYPDSELNPIESPFYNEESSSSWAETYMSGSYQMHPLSVVMQQRFILQYLAALGDYQELLVPMFEHKALKYISHFIDSRDTRLAFDALKFLAAFLTHKKFAQEFLDHGGLPELLRVKRRGMASSGVSICLCYLASNDDVMEKICYMNSHSKKTVESMVDYGLFLLERSYDSSRDHAAMFFSLCFHFPLLLKLFDRGDGLRKLLNLISMRSLISDDLHELEDDEQLFRRQTAKRVCIALKKYTRAHFMSEMKKRTNNQPDECKHISLSDESVMEEIEVHRQQAGQRISLTAIDRIARREFIDLILKIIALIRNEVKLSETLKNALEILVVCSLSTNVQYILLDHPSLAEIVKCADVEDAECQKSALNILINLVSSNHQARPPPPMLGTPGSARKKKSLDLRKAIWANNGTFILPKLLTQDSRAPTQADTIRSLACRVLCGLAKEDTIRHDMSKLPLFTDGQLQSLMKKPILQEKRIEHGTFCKYCKELIELVTGTQVTSLNGIEPSLAEVKRRNVVARTKIEYDVSEAFQLMYDFLIFHGKTTAAAALYKDCNLSSKHPSQKSTSNLCKKLDEPSASTPITLDSIFTEHLRQQHNQCKNPVSICPPFGLLEPHRCPEPTNKLLAPFNIASRIIKRRVFAPKGGMYGATYDRHYVYSKFRPNRLVMDSKDIRTSATCCSFSTDGQFLFVGTDGGILNAFNISTGVIEASYECHINELGYIEASCDDNLLLTTSPDSPSPQCVLWTFTDVFERKHRFDNDLHAEFGKASSDRIITTQESFCRLWDTSTGSLLQKFEGHHRYTCNRATLNYNDTLVLNDGVLWDVRDATQVVKFGKFNERINGIFHPNGNEIICNSQIWDIRNHKMVQTVPAFDMCQLKFNSMGNVIFATILDDQSELNSKIKNEFRTSFRTFDSHDYSTIATIDLKRTISDLAVSSNDEHIALVESSGNPRGFHDEYITDSNICRLYDVGVPRYDADMEGEDDEDADDEENDDDDDDDDDDDGGGGFDYDEEDFDDVYDTDITGDEDGDRDGSSDSDSHLSSSNSAASRDEIVPFSFQHSPGDEDAREGGSAMSDDDDEDYDARM